MQKLNVKALAAGLGASWGVCVLFAGLAASAGWGAGFVEMMSSVYIGFAPGLPGAAIGAVWGFADGAIGGAIIAYVYNWAASKK